MATPLSGCVDGEAAEEAGAASGAPAAGPEAKPAEFDETTGGIEGVAHDDNLSPIPGVQVALAELAEFNTYTDDGGRFSFSRVPAGSHKLFAQKLGYESSGKSVEVAAGQVTNVDVLLVVLPVAEPYFETKNQVGLFGCGASWRPPAAGVTGIAICGVAEGTQVDDFLLTFKITGPIEAWQGVVMETVWQSNQLLGAGLSINWEANGCSNVGGARFARTAGHSPLRGRVAGEQLEERLDNVSKQSCAASTCNENACTMMSRAFSYPESLGPSAPADVGITFQQKFEQFLTEFYNDPGPEGFTAVADS